MFKNTKQLLILVVALALLVGGIMPALAQTEPVIVRLGVLTAADSPGGRGAQLAIAEINGAGGITGADGRTYAFELLSVPVSTADEVRAALSALAERDVLAVFGPDENALLLETFNDLRALGVPVLTAATSDAITIADTTDMIYRSRAPEQVYMRAVATLLAEQIEQPVVAVVQGEMSSDIGESITDFTTALEGLGVSPAVTVQALDPDDLSDPLAALSAAVPDVVAMWGPPETAVALLQALRDGGWGGLFFYRRADDPAFQEAVLAAGVSTAGAGVLGVTNWAPGIDGVLSSRFLRSYVLTFGDVPDAISAAYYDGVYLVAAAVQADGGDPEAVRSALQGLETMNGLQGRFNPARFVVGETINAAVLFDLNAYAVPQVSALFRDGQIVPNEGAGGDEPALPLVTPTPTTPPTTTPIPSPTPTATPEGVYGTVDTATLNVRTGPSTDYDIIGQLSAGDTVFPVGANADFTWLVVDFRGTTGWIAAYLVDLQGNLNELSIIIPPPSPTPVPTATPTVLPFADLVIESVSVEPSPPVSGQPFTVRMVVRNVGNVTSFETAVAATFAPDGTYASATVPALQPGQAMQVLLSPTVNGVGTYTVELVMDLNNLVNEGPAGEQNNLYALTYTLEGRTLLYEAGFRLSAGQEANLYRSSTNDVRWDGSQLIAINGARLGALPGANWNALSTTQILNVSGSALARAQLPVGTIVGVVIVPEGYPAALQIQSYTGNEVYFIARVYGP